MRDDRSIAGQLATLGDELKSAVVFLTRVPPRWIGANAEIRPDFTVAARMFPVAGALVGVAGSVVLVLGWLLDLPPIVTATLAVGATVLLTGALHEDGLADFADSFGGATRERKLEIMDDSRIGTYGAAALIVSLLLRAAALAAILPRSPLAAVIALLAAEAVSRAAMVRMWHDLPAARASSLANDTGPPEYSAVLIALAIAAGIVVILALPALGWRATALASVLSIAGAYGVVRLAANALGGRTGDTLGACQQVALAAFLVGASSV